MAASNLCRLCRTSCNDGIRLTDANGATNEVYNITIKYFNPMFLEIGKETTTNQLAALLCKQCWHHICDFNNFQQTVLLLHANLQKTAESVTVAENLNFNTESMPDVSNAVLRIKPDPEIITPDNDLQENLNEPLIMKFEAKPDTIEPFNPTSAEYYANVPLQIKNEDEFQCEEFIIDEFIDESKNSNISDDELLEIGRAPQWSNESCNESELYDSSLGDNDLSNTSELPGPSHVKKVRRQTKRKKSKDPKESDELIAKWKPILNCELCPKSFPTLTLLKEHFLTDHPNEEFYIMCCERKFIVRYSIEQHATLHTDPEALSCKICGNRFTAYSNLNVHMYTIHSDERKVSVHKSAREVDEVLAKWKPELKCEYCPKLFSTYSSLRTHFRIDHRNKEFYIKCCDSKLKCRANIVRHATQHLNCKTSQCYLNMPKMHRKTTMGVDEFIAKWKPYLKCEYCPESFPTYTLLKKHCKDQHPDKEFYILCCERKFKYRYSVEGHAIMHMDATAFRCVLCGNCMTSKFTLNGHITKMHPGAKFSNGKNDDYNFKCSLCDFCCCDEATLVQHGSFHTDPNLTYRCRHCSSAFDNYKSLQQHMTNSHTRKDNPPGVRRCELCPKTFRHRSGMHYHIKTVHPEEFEKRRSKLPPKTMK
ncbi:zinc finger protein 711-like isoform X3 [Musca autumnalis]